MKETKLLQIPKATLLSNLPTTLFHTFCSSYRGIRFENLKIVCRVLKQLAVHAIRTIGNHPRNQGKRETGLRLKTGSTIFTLLSILGIWWFFLPQWDRIRINMHTELLHASLRLLFLQGSKVKKTETSLIIENVLNCSQNFRLCQLERVTS